MLFSDWGFREITEKRSIERLGLGLFFFFPFFLDAIRGRNDLERPNQEWQVLLLLVSSFSIFFLARSENSKLFSNPERSFLWMGLEQFGQSSVLPSANFSSQTWASIGLWQIGIRIESILAGFYTMAFRKPLYVFAFRETKFEDVLLGLLVRDFFVDFCRFERKPISENLEIYSLLQL